MPCTAATLTIFLLAGGSAMAGLFGKNTLFSAVEGTVTDNGKPIAGARIVVSARLSETQALTVEATTDISGNFSTASIEKGKGLSGLLPQEFVVGQRIYIHHNGEKYLGWSHIKRRNTPLTESGGKKFVLECDISTEPEIKGDYRGVCTLVKG